MANHSFSFPGESFGNMQQNIGQHLQSQQNIAGVPDNYAHAWTEVSEQYRISNGTVGGPQAPQAAHQVSPHSPASFYLGFLRFRLLPIFSNLLSISMDIL